MEIEQGLGVRTGGRRKTYGENDDRGIYRGIVET